MNKPEPLSSGERVARRRAALRAQGMRPKQIWVPDVRSAEFRAEARRQSLLIANSEHEAEHQAWIDAVYDWDALPPYDAPLPE